MCVLISLYSNDYFLAARARYSHIKMCAEAKKEKIFCIYGEIFVTLQPQTTIKLIYTLNYLGFYEKNSFCNGSYVLPSAGLMR